MSGLYFNFFLSRESIITMSTTALLGSIGLYSFEKDIKTFEEKAAAARLMSYAAYSKRVQQHWQQYDGYSLFKLAKGDQHLYYCGVSHSFDKRDHQFEKLKSHFDDFLSRTEKDNIVVFVEGRADKLPCDFAANIQEAIQQCGEMGFMVFLARKHNVALVSPEPSESYELNELLKQFSKDEIAYQRFARQVVQWHRYDNKKPDFNKYFSAFFSSGIGWDDFDFSVENMASIHQSLFGISLNLHDRKWFESITDPVKAQTSIGKLTRISSIIRDLYMLEKIREHLSAGKSLFIVYGCTHAVMQEPTIKGLWKMCS